MRRGPYRTRAGFTLVEILCVVVILGIAGAIIVPQMVSRNDLKARAAARVLMADLIYAQNRAITYQQMQYVQFDSQQQNYTLKSGSAMTVIDHPVNRCPYVMRFGKDGPCGLGDVQVVSAGFVGQSNPGMTQPVIAFDALGVPYACDATGVNDPLNSGTILLQSGQNKVRVTVEPYTGQITVAEVP